MAEVEKLGVDPKIVKEAAAILIPRGAVKNVYYAHVQPIYGTAEEESDADVIGAYFPDHHLVNPAAVSSYKIRDMGFYLGIVERCDDLVYKRFRGLVMAGVGQEAEHAFRRGIGVYEIADGTITRVHSVPSYLSREETVALFEKLGLRRDNGWKPEPVCNMRRV